MDIAYGLPTGYGLPWAQYRPYIHVVTDHDIVSIFIEAIYNSPWYLHYCTSMLQTVSSALEKNSWNDGQVGGAIIARPIDRIEQIKAFVLTR